MNKHKHYDCIVAWAAGAEIQVRGYHNGEFTWHDCVTPHWAPHQEYRIKPYKKPDEVRYANFDFEVSYLTDGGTPLLADTHLGDLYNYYDKTPTDKNLKITFEDDLQGGYKLKSIEVLS